MTYHALNGRGYGHVTVFKCCLCRDAARRVGLSATADACHDATQKIRCHAVETTVACKFQHNSHVAAIKVHVNVSLSDYSCNMFL